MRNLFFNKYNPLCGNVLRLRRTIAAEFGSPFPVLLFLENSFNFHSLFIHNNSQYNNSFFLDFLNVKVPCSPSVIYQVNQLPFTAIVLGVLWGFDIRFLGFVRLAIFYLPQR